MDAEVTELRTRITSLERWAHGLANEKFSLENRMRNLTRSLGFESLQEAEESQKAGGTPLSTSVATLPEPPLLTNDVDAYLKRIEELEKEGERTRVEAARYAREVELLSAENRSLVQSAEETRIRMAEVEQASVARRQVFDERLALRDATIEALKTQIRNRNLEAASPGALCAPTLHPNEKEKETMDFPLSPSRFQDISALTDELKAHKAQNASLQVKYDALLNDKLKLAAVYRRRVEEWKSFKAWLYSEALKKKASSSISTANSGRAHERKAVNGMERNRGKIVTEVAISAEDEQGRTALDMIGDLVDAAEQVFDESLKPSGSHGASLAVGSPAKKRKRQSQLEPSPAAPPSSNPSGTRGVVARLDDQKQSEVSVVHPPTMKALKSSPKMSRLSAEQPTANIISAALEGISTLKTSAQSLKAEGASPTTPQARKANHTVGPFDEIIDLTVNSQGSETQAPPSEGSPTQQVPTSSPNGPASQHSPSTSPCQGKRGLHSSSLVFLGENNTPGAVGRSLIQSHGGRRAVVSQLSSSLTVANSRSASQASTPKTRTILKPIPPPPPLADIIRTRLAPGNGDCSGPGEGPSTESASPNTSARLKLVTRTPKLYSELPKGYRALGPTSLTDPRPLRARTDLAADTPTLTPLARKGRDVDDENKRKARTELRLFVESKDPAINAEPDGTTASSDIRADMKRESKRPGAIRRVSKSTSSPAVFQSFPSSPTSPVEDVPASNVVRDVRRKDHPERLTMTREQHPGDLKTIPTGGYREPCAPHKRRGRYAQSAADERDEGINSRYEVHKEKNDGLQHPFDEVVRNKSSRKQMHAVDCPCCKNYYEVVGPLPPRLAPPPWKTPSPPSSPSRITPRHGEWRHRSASPSSPSKHQRQRQKEIQEHRQEVSRHRHRWVPANTPPDYWTIGFPDTQQVADINRRAKEMNTAKRKYVEDEASKEDGRYRKKLQ